MGSNNSKTKKKESIKQSNKESNKEPNKTPNKPKGTPYGGLITPIQTPNPDCPIFHLFPKPKELTTLRDLVENYATPPPETFKPGLYFVYTGWMVTFRMYPDGTFTAEYDDEVYTDYWRGVYFIIEHLVALFTVSSYRDRSPEWDKEVTLDYSEKMEIVELEKVKFQKDAVVEGWEAKWQEIDIPFPEKPPPPREPCIKRACPAS